MDSVKVQIIIEKLRSQGRMVFIDGATEEQIAAFEHEHKVSLPGKYKEWLRFSDGGELFLPAGIQLYGVTHKPLIDVENNDRPDERYIVIGAMAFGDPILFERESEKIAIGSSFSVGRKQAGKACFGTQKSLEFLEIPGIFVGSG